MNVPHYGDKILSNFVEKNLFPGIRDITRVNWAIFSCVYANRNWSVGLMVDPSVGIIFESQAFQSLIKIF